MSIIVTPWDERVLVTRGGSFDPVGWFAAEELDVSRRFRLQKRRDEWLASRIVLKQLVMARGLCEDPRRCTFDRPRVVIDGRRRSWFASVSHSGDCNGAVIGQEPVGIDVQIVRAVSESAAHLFLSDAEIAAMQRCTIPDRLLHFWCAKEAAWKRRSDEFTTLRQVPLALIETHEAGLLFDAAETVRIDELIVAVTR